MYFLIIRLIPKFYDMYIIYIKKSIYNFIIFLQSKIQKIKQWLQLLMVHVSMTCTQGQLVQFFYKYLIMGE
jgi:hypothetical protein